MGARSCKRESDVLAALRSGALDEATSAHVAGCASCRELLGVMPALLALADVSGEMPRLPEPGHLWLKARLLQGWEAERRATLPIDAMQHAGIAIGVVGAALLVLWQWPEMTAWFAETDPAQLSTWVSTVTPFSVLPLLIASAVLLAGTLVFTVHALLTE